MKWKQWKIVLKGLNLSYYMGETLLMNTYIYTPTMVPKFRSLTATQVQGYDYMGILSILAFLCNVNLL